MVIRSGATCNARQTVRGNHRQNTIDATRTRATRRPPPDMVRGGRNAVYALERCGTHPRPGDLALLAVCLIVVRSTTIVVATPASENATGETSPAAWTVPGATVALRLPRRERPTVCAISHVRSVFALPSPRLGALALHSRGILGRSGSSGPAAPSNGRSTHHSRSPPDFSAAVLPQIARASPALARHAHENPRDAFQRSQRDVNTPGSGRREPS